MSQPTKDALASLVATFRKENLALMNESQARLSYIDKFWNALGWDTSNTVQVQVEIKLDTKRPDYRFVNGRRTLFFVEAKKPAEDLTNPKHIYQAKLYCWNGGTPLVILTDFEEFRPFRALGKPKLDDAKKGLIKSFDMTYEAYPDRADDLLNAFGREAALAGSLQSLVKATPKELRDTVDKDFLLTLSEWRKKLAQAVANRNTIENEFDLAEAVQRILDRLVFIRILEDRAIEDESHLEKIGAKGVEKIYEKFVALCQRFAPKYNGLIFNPHPVSENLELDDAALRPILKELMYEESPYRFDEIPVEMLGTIYERFLGDEIRLTDGGRAKVETKPEVRKAGGVYYTPQYIVDYIVQNTVGNLLAACGTRAEVEKLKIVDPACGSGSFLLGAFEAFIKWHEWYFETHLDEIDEPVVATGKGRKAGQVRSLAYRNVKGELRLTAMMKGRILQRSIFGVDVDRQATEVAQMSLYLKVLEGLAEEAQGSLGFQEAILPKLADNIVCGNSLIGTDFLSEDFFGLSEKERQRLNPFDWQEKFPFLKETGGFDAVIGNPPYVRQESLGDLKPYFEKHYAVYHGAGDLYTYFIERSLSLLKPDGLYSIIVANKWMRANYGQPLRKWMKAQRIEEIIDFGDLPVFEQATTYPCILTLRKAEAAEAVPVAEVKSLNFSTLADALLTSRYSVRVSSLDDGGWSLSDDSTKTLLEKLKASGKALGQYVNGEIYRGVLTGLNEAFVIDAETKARLIAEDARSAELIKPFLAGRDIKRYAPLQSDKFLIFTRRGTDIKKYPAIEKHLLGFKEQLMPKPDSYKGNEWSGRKPGNYKWFEIQDTVDYYDKFETRKIIYPNICKQPEFTFDTEKLYTNQKCFIISLEDRYLLGVLNSRVSFFLFQQILPKLRGDFYEPSYIYFKDFPIADATAEAKAEIEKLVERMMELKRKAAVASAFERSQIESFIKRTDTEIDEAPFSPVAAVRLDGGRNKDCGKRSIVTRNVLYSAR